MGLCELNESAHISVNKGLFSKPWVGFGILFSFSGLLPASQNCVHLSIEADTHMLWQNSVEVVCS